MPHVDDGTLHALLDGALRAHEPDRADRVETHLDACADCRARFEEAASLRDRADEVLGALDTGLAPGDPIGAAGSGPSDAVPDFQDVLARASAGRNDRQPEAAPESGGAVEPVAGETARGGSVRRRYQWTRGLAWAATLVVALGTGYLIRDLAGPTGVVPPARSALEQGARGAAAEPDAGSDAAMADELDADGLRPETSAAGEEAGADGAVSGEGAGGGAVSGEPAGTGAQSGDAEQGAPEAGQRRPAVESPTEPRGQVTADVQAPAAKFGAETEARARAAPVETEWRNVSLAETRVRDVTVLRLPTASITSVELGPDESVQTRQLLGEGVEIVVRQEVRETTAIEAMEAAPAEDRAGGERAEAQVAEAMAPAAAVPSLMGFDPDSAAATMETPVTVTVARDGYVLTLTGRLPEDVLRALAATALPVAP